MGSASKLWAKAEQNAGEAGKALNFDEDLGDALDELDRLVGQYLAMEARQFRVARRMFAVAKKVRRAADGDTETIQEAAAGAKSKEDKASLTTLLAQVDRVVDDMQSTVDELSFRIKRQVTLLKRIDGALK